MGFEHALTLLFDRGTLTIPAEITKTKVGRTIPLSPHLLDELATWGVREGYIIPSARKEGGPRERQVRARDISRAWERAGVRCEVWKGRPDRAFRSGFKSALLGAGAHADAVDFLQGHIDEGARGRYIDPWQLPLMAVVKMIPKIGGTSG